MYKNILFDIDGTLFDPGQGMLKSFSRAVTEAGLPDKPEEFISYIGKPLAMSITYMYDINKETAEKVTRAYRKHFMESGVYEAFPYPGIPELLRELKNAGKRLFVASSKQERAILVMLENARISELFDGVYGATDDSERAEKNDIIAYLLKTEKLDRSETVMVGDRHYDIIGARKSGIHVVGVLYGFGSREELEESAPDYIAADAEELKRVLIA